MVKLSVLSPRKVSLPLSDQSCKDLEARSIPVGSFPSAVRFFLLFTIYLLMHLSCPLTSARFFIISSQNRQNPAIHSSHFLGIVITVKAKRPITHHFFIHPLLFFKKKELLPSRVPSFFGVIHPASPISGCRACTGRHLPGSGRPKFMFSFDSF